MPSLHRSHTGVRIETLTPTLLDHLRAQASVALNGDGTCSLENMEISCFASEFCSANTFPSMDLEHLRACLYAFVAVTDMVPQEYAGFSDGGVRFIGCVSANPPCKRATNLLPHMNIDALVISNLCVAPAYRTLGVGRRLIESILNLRAPDTFLMVARGPDESNDASGDLLNIFDQRVPRLVAMYEQRGFRQINADRHAVLLQYVNAHKKKTRTDVS